MYHLYLNTPDGTAANCKPSQLVRAAIMSPAEYCRIKTHLCWKQLQSWEAEQRNQQIRVYKKCSQDIVKTWRNTLVNKQMDRKEKRKQRLQLIEDRKNALYEQSCLEREKEREKKLEEVRRYLLLERDDIRAINSAYVFTEILRERDAQLKFKEKELAKEKQTKEEYEKCVKKDTEHYQELRKGFKDAERKAKINRRNELIEQMRKRKQKYEGDFEREKAMEKEDLLLMQEEMKLIEENIRKETERKRDICKNDLLESRRYAEEKAKLQKLIDEDQDKAIEIYLKFKRRIDCLIQKQLDRESRELLERQDIIRKKVFDSITAEEAKRLRNEDNAVKAAEASADNEEKKREDQKDRHKRDCKEQLEEIVRKKKEMEENEKAVNVWEMALSFKRQEADKIREIKRKEEEWEKKMETRKGYNAQIEEKRAKLQAERDEAFRELCLMIYDDNVVHEAFFKYAKQYLEKARKNNANEHPILKEIQRYRVRNGFQFKDKHDKRRKADRERWRAPPPECASDAQNLENALTIWQPKRVCPTVCPDGKIPEDNVCVTPESSLPKIPSGDICAKIRQEIALTQKGLL